MFTHNLHAESILRRTWYVLDYRPTRAIWPKYVGRFCPRTKPHIISKRKR